MGNQYIIDNQGNMVDAGHRLTTCDGTCPAPIVSARSRPTSLSTATNCSRRPWPRSATFVFFLATRRRWKIWTQATASRNHSCSQMSERTDSRAEATPWSPGWRGTICGSLAVVMGGFPAAGFRSDLARRKMRDNPIYHAAFVALTTQISRGNARDSKHPKRGIRSA